MITRKTFYQLILLAVLVWASCTPASLPEAATDWPEITQTAKPWTRWWWHGSAVNKTDLSREMEAYRDAGLGGVELTPIFGVIGRENEFVDYLSPEWMTLFQHSLQEAGRLGLGFDMANGTGWPFGGPWVGAEDAPKYLAHKTYQLKGGERLREAVTYTQQPVLRAVRNQLYQLYGILQKEGETVTGSMKNPVEINTDQRLQISDLVEPISANKNLQGLALDQVRFEKPLPLQALMAYADDGQVVNLTDKVNEASQLDWTAPAGNWTLYALFQGWHGKMVERAAPGGEGNTLDHFSEEAISHYLARFDSAFAGQDLTGLRAFFNDSYEVDDAAGNADWTPRFLEEFRSRRGYDLLEHLPALYGHAEDKEAIARVNSDYRETLSDLILVTFTTYWGDWAHRRNAITRNQSHGSPANILDLYAASDIPETEGEDLLMVKFASSAAHVSGKNLVSSESATWLNEHFMSSLADIRKNLERYFLGGVNHVFYHGTAYSPQEEPWPGRLFYAAVHLNPRNPLWRDFPALNQYAARIQSFLQDGQPANDVLLYFPIYDRFAEDEPGFLEHFHGKEAGFERSNMKADAELMQESGFTYDYISDRQIGQLRTEAGAILTGGVRYQTIVIPETAYMPLESFRKLQQLAENGATVIIHNALPGDVPGLGDLENRQKGLSELKAGLSFAAGSTAGVQEAAVGQGRFLLGNKLEELLDAAGVKREKMTDLGLQFIRRSRTNGHHYYLVNWEDKPAEGWVSLGVDAASAYLYEPVSGQKGLADSRTNAAGELEVYLQVPAHSSCILKTFIAAAGGDSYPYVRETGNPQEITGPWKVSFLSGGPELPAETTMEQPASWTNMPDASYQYFSGTAVYSATFPKPQGEAYDAYLLDLGQVAVSARVKINGTELGTLIGPNYSLLIPAAQFTDNNTLEIEVTNLMANRIIDLDKREVFWKKFYNVNFPARLQENRGDDGLFSATAWQPFPSGLLGPVQLSPVRSGRQ